MIKRYTNVQLLYFTLPHISYIPLSRMHAQFLFNQPCFLDLVEAVLADYLSSRPTNNVGELKGIQSTDLS